MLHALAPKLLPLGLPFVCKWAAHREAIALRDGIPLSAEERIDAERIGVIAVDRVRLLRVDAMPTLSNPLLIRASRLVGLDSSTTIALSLGHSILIQSNFWKTRRLVVHELVHTHQFERMGGFRSFLRAYLSECLTTGYPDAPLEQEALQVEREICGLRTNTKMPETE